MRRRHGRQITSQRRPTGASRKSRSHLRLAGGAPSTAGGSPHGLRRLPGLKRRGALATGSPCGHRGKVFRRRRWYGHDSASRDSRSLRAGGARDTAGPWRTASARADAGTIILSEMQVRDGAHSGPYEKQRRMVGPEVDSHRAQGRPEKGGGHAGRSCRLTVNKHRVHFELAPSRSHNRDRWASRQSAQSRRPH